MAGHFLAALLLVSTCDFIGTDKNLTGVLHFSGKEFAGSETCAGCHTSISESHRLTPHFLTSAAADTASVMGSFVAGENVLVVNERLRVMMEQTGKELFQKGFVNDAEVIRKPLDITIGSGRKGQSYLYWQENSLFQLPVSYYRASDTWSNSPGYPTDQLVFDRNIPARCLECHSTYFKTGKAIAGRETFDQNQVMLGVDCERCHSPAGDHVRFHLKHPAEKEARNIINPARLTRQQKLDNCALCHSGIRENLMPSFSYVVGDNLEDFSYASYPADSGATLDVHGNQYGLLLASKCFRMSKMDCSSCHNVHVKETNQLELFSSRCMNCHGNEGDHFCKQPHVPGLVLSKNCIDCHMPVLPSRQVALRSANSPEVAPFFVRTHLIATYEENVKTFLAKLKSSEPSPNSP